VTAEALALAPALCVTSTEPEADTVEDCEGCSDAEEAPEPVRDTLPVRDWEGEALAETQPVGLRVLVVLAVPQADSVGVLEVVEEADWEPDRVLVREEVVEEEKEAVLVGDCEGEPEALALKEAVAGDVGETEGEADTLGVTLAEPVPLPLDSSVPVALGEVLADTVSLREGRVEKVCVTDTVKVTPVGKAVMLTVGVPGMGVLVTVMVILGVLEGEMPCVSEEVGEEVGEGEREEVVVGLPLPVPLPGWY
jgi:hypothetical protein